MQQRVRIWRIGLLLVGFFFVLGLGRAMAQNVACFDWDCTSDTGYCEFDASCTQNSGLLWRYRWDFGDGSGYTFTGSATISHQYSLSSCFYPNVELTVIDYDEDPFSKSCQITYKECVGPAQGQSGRCSN